MTNLLDLLNDVSPDDPCGKCLEYDATYLELSGKVANKPDDPITGKKTGLPNWFDIQKNALTLLHRTKDLRVVIYLLRALIHNEGLLGFRDGLSLLLELLEKYWGTIHPQLDAEDGFDPTVRLNIIEELNNYESVIQPLRLAVLVDSKSMGRFCLRDILIATDKMDLIQKEKHKPDLALIKGAFWAMPTGELTEINRAIKDCQRFTEQLKTFINEKVGVKYWSELSALVTTLKDFDNSFELFMNSEQVESCVEAFYNHPDQEMFDVFSSGQLPQAETAPSENKNIAPFNNFQPDRVIQKIKSAKAGSCSCKVYSGIRDTVYCSVFAPACVNTQIDKSFLVQVFTHLSEQAEAVKVSAKEFDETTERRGCKCLETEIERSSKLTFHLTIPSLDIAFPLQTLTWKGDMDFVQFAVEIPSNVRVGNKLGTVTISQDSVPIGQISFNLILSQAKSSGQSKITGNASVYKNVFISYAASDRNEVMKRVQMLSRLGVNFFQDLLSIEPGQQWEQEIYRHIEDSDVFFLFWSSAAKASDWVMKEVEYAIELKSGNDTNPPAIIPVIIEGPPPVPPPKELSHLNFNDYLLYLQI